MGFWEGLGNTVPKKGYSKHTRKIARKVSKKPLHEARKPITRKKHMTKQKALKWRAFKTYESKDKALSMARHLRETDGYQTRVDGTARGYQVWIKS